MIADRLDSQGRHLLFKFMLLTEDVFYNFDNIFNQGDYLYKAAKTGGVI